ncbi:MAG: DNA-directed RNA polymerase subunit H [Candidatus Aenigmatarchaeota archaeon]
MSLKGDCINILEHVLVPKFRVLSDEEKARLLEKLKSTKEKFPKILQVDPIVTKIEAKKGDILEIKRKSEVAGEYVYYRLVV